MTGTIDKTGWKKVEFGDICRNLNITVRDPLQQGLVRFIGLDHIEPNNLHITHWGDVSEGTTFTKRFKKGDVLFGKRRAYQRKVAVADFDGICSGDILVFDPIEKSIDPKLLPFICLSEGFFDHAIKTSAGSLSPRTKFQDLSRFQFLLPPFDQQTNLAELLWAADKTLQCQIKLQNSYSDFFTTVLNELVIGKSKKMTGVEFKTFNIKDLGSIYGGLSGKNKNDFGQGSPFVTYMNIFSNYEIDPNGMDYVNVGPGEKQNQVKYGDIFFTGSSETPDEVGMSSVLLKEIPGCFLNSFCFGFRLFDFNTLLPEYAKYYFRSHEVRKFMTLYAQGYTRYNLSKNTVLQKFQVTLPSLFAQKEICNILGKIQDQQIAISNLKNQTKIILGTLINKIFM